MLIDFFSAAFPWILLRLSVAFACAYLEKRKVKFFFSDDIKTGI